MIKSKATKKADRVIAVICFFIILICLLPILNILARSLSSADALIRGKVFLWPVDFNLTAYQTVLSDPKYIRSLLWTAFLTVICTCASMFMTTICSYPLIYKELKGRKVFSVFILLTMYFNAGTIPNYLLLKDIGLLNTPAVLVVPGVLSVFNVVIMRSFLYGIPESLREAAEVEGAGPIRILFHVYLPLSKPVLATLSLFYAVGRWNGFSDALMYMNKREYYPIQLLLYNILNNTSNVEVATQEGFSTPGLSETLRSATVMFAVVPILMIYPWLQRYFITGMTLGAVKE
ncbi:MAG: carbohydrate ABC transporter permease [Hungatella sp.]|jgi:putative aldouronate transport system permease protein|nr:carbohydrate ABC transporter permease [Hungatella sp.]MDR1772576.1 carbohydrate ABC transporter permease [Hungatella sp.]